MKFWRRNLTFFFFFWVKDDIKFYYKIRGCLDSFFYHLIFITLHVKYHVCLAPSLTSHHSIFFTLFVGPIPVTSADFSFFFFQYPNSLNPVEKKKTKPEQTELVKKRKKKNRTANPRKKKHIIEWTKDGQKLRLWIPYVCLITILPLSYELWKLKNNQKLFSVSITHNSKIRELSDGN